MHRPTSPTSEALHRYAASMPSLTQLFAEQPGRAQQLSASIGSLYIDFSKQRIDAQAFDLLFQRAEELDLAGQIAALFAGEKVNLSEQRAALHWLLRKRDSELPEALTEPAKTMLAAHQAMQTLCEG